MVIGCGFTDRELTEREAEDVVVKAFDTVKVEGKRVLFIIPDGTRSAPVGLFFRLFHKVIGKRVKRMDYLIALGTHRAMTQDEINARLELTARDWQHYPNIKVFNHVWDNPASFRKVGTITAKEMTDISGGLLKREISIEINKLIYDYDMFIILGPTFPHEVVGFSGGNKYMFPGICGAEFLNLFHWLGALITNVNINGVIDTPVRAAIDRAASFIGMPYFNFDMVVHYGKLKGLFFGEAREAWRKAADLSSQLHIIFKNRKFSRVLGIAPKMYDDIWTAGKVMYKLEPVIEDGGELVIYAPHITEISYTHGANIDRIGYHVRDYFLAQMDKFKDVPLGVIAHSTHVRGGGTFVNGVEKPRVNVVLATGIPEERCTKVNLGYRNPATVNADSYKNREQEGVLFVEKAGEMLYRYAG
ncbi:MAG: DUF2088 domain-containing protein [Spirochaetes bacterium]|nr:DUF2088 domain-containing protein [Spirochaetota bacterium]